jgi:acetyltransferase
LTNPYRSAAIPQLNDRFRPKAVNQGSTVAIRHRWRPSFAVIRRHHAEDWTLADGTVLSMRPIAPGDAAAEQAFVRRLSPHSRYLRLLSSRRELGARELAEFTSNDPLKGFALVVTRRGVKREEQIAVGRYALLADGATCEFALAVADAWQGMGIGARLLAALIRHARAKGVARMDGFVHETNADMLRLARNQGIEIPAEPGDDSALRVTRSLRD